MNKSICFIIPNYVFFSTGGAELQVYLLSEEFVKRGWQVEIITGKQPGYRSLRKSKYYNPKIVYHFYKVPRLSFWEFFRSWKILLRTGCHFYYIRTDFAFSGGTALYTKVFKKKLIYALAHIDCTHKNRYSLELNRERYQNFFKFKIRQIDVFLRDKAIEYAKRNADLILAQNFEQKKALFQNFGLNCQVLPNSYPLELSLTNIRKENIILWVANCRPFKQPQVFLNLVNNLNLPDWQFVMIGKPGIYLSSIEDLDKFNFRYLGELSYEETIKWFKKAKLLVNTSLSEGFSNTFIQAWYYKVYILTLIVDPEKLLSEQHYGSCSKGDFKKLKRKLIEITSEYNSIEKDLDIAFQFAINEFSLKKNVDRFENILSINQERTLSVF